MSVFNTHSDSILRIDLDALADNYALLSTRFKSGVCSAVVKADAYGLGMAPIAKKLKSKGCNHFFVATLDEAIELRSIISDTHIYAFNGISRNQERYFLENNIVPVLNSPEQVVRWKAAADEMGKRLPAILHFDTGMNRLGLDWYELENVMKSDASEALDFEYVMSHLACAETPDHPLNATQLRLINKARSLFPGSGISFASSSALFLDERYHFDLARPGCALYGINPTPGRLNPMKNVVTLTTKILQVRVIDTVTTVGYGATCDLARGSTVATIPVGYADGMFRSLSSIGKVYIAGHIVPIVGRVSMDLITLDISNLPESVLHKELDVELIGENMPLEKVAKAADTNGYEVLTNLGSRFSREYVGRV